MTVDSPTCTVVAEVSRPRPSIVVTPRAFSSDCRPLYFFATMPVRYFVTPSMSTDSKLERMP